MANQKSYLKYFSGQLQQTVHTGIEKWVLVLAEWMPREDMDKTCYTSEGKPRGKLTETWIDVADG